MPHGHFAQALCSTYAARCQLLKFHLEYSGWVISQDKSLALKIWAKVKSSLPMPAYQEWHATLPGLMSTPS